jgi:outer membrane receptor for ferrienterochelin and colicins
MTKSHLILIFATLFSINLFSQEADHDTIGFFYQPEDVVITAQYAPTDSKSAIHKVRVIKSADILKRNANDLGELLSLESNISVSNDLILGSSLSLQGVSGQNIKIMIDGVPVIGRSGDNIDLSQITLENVERIEIVEGPLSVNYGTNALGGVINIITKKSQLNKYEAGLKTRYENPGAFTTNLWAGFRITPKLLMRLSGERFLFDGFGSITEGGRNVLWNPKEKWSGDALLRYYLNDDNVIAYTFSTFNESVENLGDKRRPQFKPYAYDDYYNTVRYSNSLFHEGTVLEKYYLKSTVAYNKFDRIKTSYRYEFETEERTPVESEIDTIAYEAYMLRSVFASKYTGKINFQFGVDLNYETAFGKKIADDESDKAQFSMAGDYAAFGSLTYKPLTKFIIQAGLRVAKHTRYDAPVIPSLNIKYDFNRKAALRLSYAKGFRSPTLKELYYYFVDFNHYIVGNPDLKAEISDNIQAAFTYKHKKASAGLTIFYNDIQNKIDLFEFAVVNGQVVPAVGTVDYTYFNQNRFKSLGSTMRFNSEWKNLSFKFGITGTGRFNILSDDFTEVPPFSFLVESNGRLSYNFPKLGMDISLFARNYDKTIQYFSGLDDEGNAVILQNIRDGYTLMDGNISKSFLDNKIKLSVGAKNLLDVSQVNFKEQTGGTHGSTGGSVPVSWGRSYFVSLNVKFVKK